MLYPRTKLPLTLPSPMPRFRNRLHRLYALRRLFKDVNIETMSMEENIAFHQRAFSLAKIPTTPGYHLHTMTMQDMQRDLTQTWTGVQQLLLDEKALSKDEKVALDKEFDDHVEAARSLLPDDMSLNESFPVGSMIGLTRDEASMLLLHYHESNNEVKNAAYYKKRDATIFLYEIFVILDRIQSKRIMLSPTPSNIDDDEDEANPVSKKVITQDDKTLAVVTPIPPSPSKRRRTDPISTKTLNMKMIQPPL